MNALVAGGLQRAGSRGGLTPTAYMYKDYDVANWTPNPQSAASDAPVIADASSDATNATRFATSAGVAMRPIGCARMTPASAATGSDCCWNHSSTRFVRVHPGDTALTRMPYG